MLNSQKLRATTHITLRESKVMQICTYQPTALHLNCKL